MGRFYSVNFIDLATGSVAATFTTLAAIIAANTPGYRGRVRRLIIGPGGEAPGDNNTDWRLIRSDLTTAGTKTAQTPAQLDPASLASIMTAGINYTVELGNLETVPLLRGTFNGRGGYADVFGVDDAPKWGPNQAIALQFAPAVASPMKVTGTIEFEEW